MMNSKERLLHPLFVKIREEHQSLLLNAAPFNSSMPEQLDQLHKKEEILLFKKVKNHPRLCEGGPLCTYYFDEHIHSPPLALAQSLTGRVSEDQDHLKDLISPQTTLLIPIDEHRALSLLAHFCIKNKETENARAFFMRILKNHFHKEENCFFHVCLKLLTNQELDDIWKNWQTFSPPSF